ncbi:hypothetical protein CDLVIII_1350 [Clostridium sp. DL-VIII]|uniref:DUF2577 family protein n=1 Tax=Clostridium sp. DL-VIII TaxID=641107 RepID=UPI00023AF845|nr:DUF2577 family protein [Clostridium sp. DL-VIII]EHI98049.1 hypothetical protein CDLVIII_1350 [Clostridium sp. DL-VIII]
MDDYRVGFAKMFNDRNNVDSPQFQIGKVVSLNPLKISISDGAAYFTEGQNLKVCETLKIMTGSIVINGESQTFSITRNLNVNDEVLCFPLNKKYFIAFDKV